jgi:hypothetical protein
VALNSFLKEQLKDEGVEELWLANDRERDARRLFSSSRRRRVARRMLALIGLGLPRKVVFHSREASYFEIAIEDIAGLAGAKRALGLPPMPQALARAWKEEYDRAEDIERFEPFSLIMVEGYWYLEGGERELIRIELARTRGSASVSGRSESAKALHRVARPSVASPCTDCCGRIAS